MAKKKYTRRTTAQICADKKKIRAKLYRQRKSIEKKKGSTKFSDLKIDRYSLEVKGEGTKTAKREFKTLHRKYASLDKKIADINTYLFRCSPKFKKLKEQKRKLQYRRANIRRNLSLLPKTEKERKMKELREIKRNEVMLEKAMGEDAELKRGKIFFKSNAQAGTFGESEVAWKMKEVVGVLVSSGRFDFITIEGELFPISGNELEISLKLDWLLEEIMSFQSQTSTPMVWVKGDENNKEIFVTGLSDVNPNI